MYIVCTLVYYDILSIWFITDAPYGSRDRPKKGKKWPQDLDMANDHREKLGDEGDIRFERLESQVVDIFRYGLTNGLS